MAVGIGIDLGTTNSCVAVVKGDEACVVEDAGGHRLHPSVLSFGMDGSVLAGAQAKEQMLVDDHNTVYSFKRLMGRSFDEELTRRIIGDLHYEVIQGPNDVPAVRVADREVSLPELSAMMLQHLKEMSSESLGVPINQAVITVPANFNDVQRSLTKVSGRISGLKVLRILNEPTAAALAYGLGSAQTERVAIYDFGGGTFDITIVELTDDIYEVLSTSGDSCLGGDDLDEAIAAQMREELKTHRKVDVSEDSGALAYIRTLAEAVKCQLSSQDEVESLVQGALVAQDKLLEDYVFRLNRARFNDLARPFVSKTMAVCEDALKLAGLDKSQLNSLVMVGGSTRVPIVRQETEQFFGLTPRYEINPDEVVAIGASLHAYALTGEQLPADPPEIHAVPAGMPASEVAGQEAFAPPVESVPPLEEPTPMPPLQVTSNEVPQETEAQPEPEIVILQSEAPPGPETSLPTVAEPVQPPIIKPKRTRPRPSSYPSRPPARSSRVPSRPPAVRKIPVISVGKSKAALLLDVTPRGLGVETAGGYCESIIERNAAIPVEQTRVFTTSHNDQTEVTINVFQGESRKAAENTKLGTVLLSNIRAAERGKIKVKVTFEIDTDGILGVSAVNQETGEVQKTKIELSGGLDDQHVEQLVAQYAKKPS